MFILSSTLSCMYPKLLHPVYSSNFEFELLIMNFNYKLNCIGMYRRMMAFAQAYAN